MTQKDNSTKGKPSGKRPQKKNSSAPKGGKPKFNLIYLYGPILLIIFAFQLMGDRGESVVTNWRFVKTEMLKNKDVDKLVLVNKERVEVYLKEDRIDRYKNGVDGINTPSSTSPEYYFDITSAEKFEENLEAAQANIPEDKQIGFDMEVQRNYLSELVPYMFPLLLIVFFFMYMRRMGRGGGSGGGGGIFNVGKSQAKEFKKDDKVSTSFKQVAGLTGAKHEIEEIVSFLKDPEYYTRLGGKIPQGALLVGPPGTGKTLLAKAVAGEADVPFFSMSGSDFVEMFVGVGASRVRDLFKQAKAKAPCIVFIDEIDAIGRARGKNAGFSSNDERENTLNQLLTEMDGFDTNSGVIVLAATNRADILDKALMRAGRFDRQIHVDLPDLNERAEIFQVHLKPLKLDPTADFTFIAKQTPGFSGADIANVCNEAALIAARHKREYVGKQDFLDAVDRIVGGLEKKSKLMSVEEKRTIAYHEAGHAAVSWLLEHAHPLVKVTIVPRGKALGAAWYLPEERQLTTKEQMLDELCATLGGRAAEEIEFGRISSGAQNDLEKVFKQAYAMVCYFGMSEKVGNVSYYDSTGQAGYQYGKPYSDKTSELIDSEIKEIVDVAYNRALTILRDNRDKHAELASILLEKEVIFTEDVIAIFGERAWQPRVLVNPVTASIENHNTPEKRAAEADEKLIDQPKIDNKEEKKDS